MSVSFNRIRIDQPDFDILRRITEREVVEWLAAKSAEQQAISVFPFTHLSLECWNRAGRDGKHWEVFWSAHCDGHCALNFPSVAAALADLKLELFDNPEAKAKAARAEAAALIKKAEDLEALAWEPKTLEAVTA